MLVVTARKRCILHQEWLFEINLTEMMEVLKMFSTVLEAMKVFKKKKKSVDLKSCI